ncbi:MAG: ATP-binding protein [Ilumatobacteraceae bacterium]
MESPQPKPEPDVRHTFGHDPDASRDARRALQPILPHDPEAAADITMAVSELVTNVVRHTDDGGVLDAWAADPFRIEVSDDNPQLPTIGVSDDANGGNGLKIIDSTADRWGVDKHPDDGKTVWVEFDEPKP